MMLGYVIDKTVTNIKKAKNNAPEGISNNYCRCIKPKKQMKPSKVDRKPAKNNSTET